jgi:hypothetical protein
MKSIVGDVFQILLVKLFCFQEPFVFKTYCSYADDSHVQSALKFLC